MDEKECPYTASDKVEANTNHHKATSSPRDETVASINASSNQDESFSKESKSISELSSQTSDVTVIDKNEPKENTNPQKTTNQNTSAEPQKFALEDETKSSNRHALPIGSTEWDELSGLSLHHLSFVLDHFLPTWHPTVTNTYWDNQKDRVLNFYKAKFTLKDEADVELCGGLINGLYVPPFHKKSDTFSPDFDKLANDLLKSNLKVKVIAKEKQVLQTDIENFEDLELYPFFALNNDCHEGFLKVQPIDESAWNQYTVEKDGQKYLSSDLVKQAFASGELLNLDDQKDAESGVEVATLNKNHVQVALLCPAWPKQAREWEDRARSSGWPSRGARKAVMQTKCLIEPVAHPRSQWREAEWAYDFSAAETMLATSLTLTQKQCYMLLQVMIEYHLQAPQIEITPILKAIFFRSMEKIPAEHWQDGATALARCFFIMLDELHQGLKGSNIPHYFLSDNNIVDHVDTKVLSKLQKIVLKLRQEPLKCIFVFDRNNKFPFSINEDYENIMGPVLDGIAVSTSDPSVPTQKYLLVLEHLTEKYFQQGCPQGAVEVAEELAVICQHYFKEKMSIIDFLQSKILSHIPPNIAVDAYEYILKRYENLGNFPGVISNMACQYAVLYCRETVEAKKDAFRERAEETFMKAKNADKSTTADGAIMLDYCVFMIACNRYEEAVPYLIRVIEVEAENIHTNNIYEEFERCTVDAHLQNEIDAIGQVSQPSLLLAYYLLVHCYITFNWKDEAQQIMNKYEKETERLCATLKNAQSWSLLGYSYMTLEDYYKAFGSFMKALEAEPAYTLARKNLKHCTAQYRVELGLNK